MAPTKEQVMAALAQLALPGGGSLAESGMVQALAVAGGRCAS
ncbi:protein of unknown function DUF59 [Rubellimicrobium thermophilum DSM 16684]|uniref:MIP18 family-like domain-containing protein n=1 Tax=Rubellimicrobium thermophilum DSM 16684 TaxID=1123069 RepID=S9R3L9_9RHOB|nr:protein of unknown function DUF59 [Rubellimicrobium thermophilum DSM 16684]